MSRYLGILLLAFIVAAAQTAATPQKEKKTKASTSEVKNKFSKAKTDIADKSTKAVKTRKAKKSNTALKTSKEKSRVNAKAANLKLKKDTKHARDVATAKAGRDRTRREKSKASMTAGNGTGEMMSTTNKEGRTKATDSKSRMKVAGKQTKKLHTVGHDANDEAVGKTDDGKTVFEGSRNGHYYLNDNGDKVYVNDFMGAKVVGTTKDGRIIYEGPRGGQFYYSASGNKVYVTR